MIEEYVIYDTVIMLRALSAVFSNNVMQQFGSSLTLNDLKMSYIFIHTDHVHCLRYIFISLERIYQVHY